MKSSKKISGGSNSNNEKVINKEDHKEEKSERSNRE